MRKHHSLSVMTLQATRAITTDEHTGVLRAKTTQGSQKVSKITKDSPESKGGLHTDNTTMP